MDRFASLINQSNAQLIVGVLIVLIVLLLIYILIRKYVGNSSGNDELIKSRDFFLKLFEESPVPYMMVEPDGTILLPNKAAQRLFGRSGEELRSYKYFQLHNEQFFVESRQIQEKFSRGVASADEEIQVARSNGDVRWVRLSAIPFKSFGSSGAGGVISMLDITEQKAVDRVKTEFVSLASHQLRTPLTAMKWFGEMLVKDEGTLTEKQRKHIDRIYDANERMIDLVNLLLSASRLELGTLKIDIVSVNPVTIAEELLLELNQQIETKALRVVKDFKGDSGNFYSDTKLLRMILQNLMTNAVKYSRDGGMVGITLHNDNDQLKVVVEDNGLGIPKAQQNKIFTKMFRADNARLQVAEGTGLGLYIVREAVNALSGEISFTSTENEGTIFTVIIPNGTHGNIAHKN